MTWFATVNISGKKCPPNENRVGWGTPRSNCHFPKRKTMPVAMR